MLLRSAPCPCPYFHQSEQTWCQTTPVLVRIPVYPAGVHEQPPSFRRHPTKRCSRSCRCSWAEDSTHPSIPRWPSGCGSRAGCRAHFECTIVFCSIRRVLLIIEKCRASMRSTPSAADVRDENGRIRRTWKGSRVGHPKSNNENVSAIRRDENASGLQGIVPERSYSQLCRLRHASK